MSTTRIAQIGLLAALTLVLGYLETLVPLPVTVPGIKLGLGNITVLFALYALDVPSALLLMGIKVFVSGFLFGSPVMVLYSLGGSALAFIGMWLLKRIDKVGMVVVSVVAAILHNVGQLGVAAAMLSTPLVFVNLPVLVIAACITGSVTGGVAASVYKALGPKIAQEHAREAKLK